MPIEFATASGYATLSIREHNDQANTLVVAVVDFKNNQILDEAVCDDTDTALGLTVARLYHANKQDEKRINVDIF